MKSLFRWMPVALVLSATVVANTGAVAWANTHVSMRAQQGAITFRLRVAGTPAPNEQFWAAYGPLAGHFGIVRLSAAGGGIYQATRTLPLYEPTSVAFIAGRGAIRTRAGLEPADVLATIATVGPVALNTMGRHVPEWHVALG